MNREQTILKYLPGVERYVKSVSRHWFPPLEREDAQSCATIAMIEAIDSQREVPAKYFDAYIQTRVSGSVVDYIRSTLQTSRLSMAFRKKIEKIIAEGILDECKQRELLDMSPSEFLIEQSKMAGPRIKAVGDLSELGDNSESDPDPDFWETVCERTTPTQFEILEWIYKRGFSQSEVSDIRGVKRPTTSRSHTAAMKSLWPLMFGGE